MARIQVLIDQPDQAGLPPVARLQAFAHAVVGRRAGELNLRVVSATESQRLNAQFRGRHKPTNVLSFPPEVPPDFPIKLLGDLALCDSVIRREATEQGKELEAHWAHMVIHGCLHLLGYDHQNEADAEKMEGREIELLAEFGFANPYTIITTKEKS